MTIEGYSTMITAFTAAFGDVPYPAWAICKAMDLDKLLRAITAVKAHPMSKHNSDEAGLVMRLALRRPKSRRQQVYDRREATL